MKLVYLASPYTHYAGGIEKAFEDVAQIAARLVETGLIVYSPIVYTHQVAIRSSIDPKDHVFWLTFDEPFMSACDTLLIAKMDGWEQSYGIKREIERFAGKPIQYVDPITLEISYS